MRRHPLIAAAVLAGSPPPAATAVRPTAVRGGHARRRGDDHHPRRRGSEMVGDLATVDVLMPPNADPHEFRLSARQAADLREADVVVANGAGFEAGLEEPSTAPRDGTVSR